MFLFKNTKNIINRIALNMLVYSAAGNLLNAYASMFFGAILKTKLYENVSVVVNAVLFIIGSIAVVICGVFVIISIVEAVLIALNNGDRELKRMKKEVSKADELFEIKDVENDNNTGIRLVTYNKYYLTKSIKIIEVEKAKRYDNYSDRVYWQTNYRYVSFEELNKIIETKGDDYANRFYGINKDNARLLLREMKMAVR